MPCHHHHHHHRHRHHHYTATRPGIAALLISKKMTVDGLMGLGIGLSNAFGETRGGGGLAR